MVRGAAKHFEDHWFATRFFALKSFGKSSMKQISFGSKWYMEMSDRAKQKFSFYYNKRNSQAIFHRVLGWKYINKLKS